MFYGVHPMYSAAFLVVWSAVGIVRLRLGLAA
jgi:hypothetical protein